MSSIIHKLKNVDISHLDAFEETVYNDLSLRMSKEEALQIIINNAEGDITQLSDTLADIAEEQNEELEILKNREDEKARKVRK